jgi:hypothetical protein
MQLCFCIVSVLERYLNSALIDRYFLIQFIINTPKLSFFKIINLHFLNTKSFNIEKMKINDLKNIKV